MAQKTITVNASASLSANGTSTATGSMTWTAPAFPGGVTAWDDVRVSGTWSWNGKGNITRVTINGTNTSGDTAFDISIAGKSSPLSISCVGNNKNATGANFGWSNLIVTYTYTDTSSHTLTVRYGATTIITDEVSDDVPVTYNGSTITTVASGQTKTLNCSGKVMATNVTVNGRTLNCNGKYMNGNIAIEVN